MEKIIITVAGKSKSGKSRIAYLLKKFLKENGLNVKHQLSIDYESDDVFDELMEKNIGDVIENFKETREITIKEIQFRK